MTIRALRGYFAVVGLFAIWVGVWGYLLPEFVDKALPWTVPPLHARFIGSMYLSGAVLMFGSMWAPMHASFVAVVMAAVWTGMLGIVSFIHLDEFEFWRSTVWFWFFAYVSFPIAGAVLAWQLRGPPVRGRSELPGWLRTFALALGVACLSLAIVLLFATDTMVTLWPWKITPLLAQIYAGPFTSYGVGALLIAASASQRAVRWPLISMAVFGVLVLAASAIHLSLLEPFGVGAMAWFGGLAISTVFLIAASIRVAR